MKKIEFSEHDDSMLTTWWSQGGSMDLLESRTGIGRSTLYRRAGELGLEEREPEKRKKTGYYQAPKIPTHGHPLVKKLYRIMRQQMISIPELADIVGITPEAIRTWANHFEPKVSNLEACFTALGFELVVREAVDENKI